MNYLTQISQISQMFYSKDSGILGFKKTEENPCLCCMLCEHSLWHSGQFLCKVNHHFSVSLHFSKLREY